MEAKLKGETRLVEPLATRMDGLEERVDGAVTGLDEIRRGLALAPLAIDRMVDKGELSPIREGALASKLPARGSRRSSGALWVQLAGIAQTQGQQQQAVLQQLVGEVQQLSATLSEAGHKTLRLLIAGMVAAGLAGAGGAALVFGLVRLVPG